MEPKPPDEEIIEKFKKVQRRQSILILTAVLIPILLIVVGTIAGDQAKAWIHRIPEKLVGIAFLFAVIAAFGFAFFNWRCPACWALQGSLSPRYCRRCGARLKK